MPPAVLAAGSAAAVDWSPLAAGLRTEVAPQGGPAKPPDECGAFACVGLKIPAADPALFAGTPHGMLAAFHLHAFAELAAYAAGPRSAGGDAFWVRVIERWLATAGRPAGAGWHPFPLSGRVMAWCAALSAGNWPHAPAQAMRASLARQLLVLRRSVEHDVGGNHLLRNATALAIGGACLGDDRARGQGERLLAREVPRQVLPAGGHVERSPSYHREVLNDLRNAAAVLERAGRPAPWAARLDDMDAWLSRLAAPDGSLPLRGDAWEGPPVPPGQEAVADLDGLVVLRGDGLHAVLQCGPLGPDHLPPHVHADALSFSLWADGRWLVADPGAFTYSGPERDRFRSTPAHATLTVGDRDQCAFWGPFRASLLPTVSRGPVERRDRGWLVVEARHDGYRPAVHVRRFAFHPAHGLVVRDRLEGGGRHEVVSRVPLGPAAVSGVDVRPLDGDARREQARYAPYLGTAVDTEVLVQRRSLAPGEECGWSLLRPGAEPPAF